MVTPAQLVFRDSATLPTDGLRARKKVKTRLAIQDAALELFSEQGYETTTVDEIAARAEVSTTTFFRYFRSKGEVILSDEQETFSVLERAIVERPVPERDLVALQRAMQQAWVPNLDAERTMLQAQAVATSHVLRGLSFDVGMGWLDGIAAALARRRGLAVPDKRCALAARLAFSVFGNAVEAWVRDGCRADLAVTIDEGFALVDEICRD